MGCIIAGASFAAGEPKFQILSTESGLSHNWVKCILQDQTGFMWFGTKDGLNRYDAYGFQTYSFDASDANSLGNSTINFLEEAPDGDIWVGTSGGLERYLPRFDHFEKVSAIPDFDALSAAANNAGIWIGTAQGLFHYSYSDGSVQSYLNDPSDPGSVLDHMCRALLIDSQGKLWVGNDKALSRLDPETGRFTNFQLGSHGLEGTFVSVLLEDATGRLWVGTNDGGLYHSDTAVSSQEQPQFSRVTSGNVSTLAIDKQATLWIGFESNQSMERISLATFPNPESYLSKPEAANAILQDPSQRSVHVVYSDSQDGVWVGTYASGVGYYNPYRKPFNFERHRPEIQDTIPSGAVNAIVQREDETWIGTDDGLSVHKNGNWHSFPRLRDDASSPGPGGVSALHLDTHGDIWVGGWANGLSRYIQESNTFLNYNICDSDGTSINSENVFAIQDDGRGSLWIGTIGGGLNRYNYQTERFTYYLQNNEKEAQLHDNYVNAIINSQAGDLWISTYNTLNRYDHETDTFEYFTREEYQGAGMANADLLDIFEDSRGAIWLGTEGGLIHFDPASKDFIQYNQTNGLAYNTINAVEEDTEGNIWFSTNTGIVKFILGITTPEVPVFSHYDSSDGLYGNQFVKRSSFRKGDGELLFGSPFGIARFYPEKMRVNPQPPRVALTQISLNNQKLSGQQDDFPLDASISQARKLTLSSAPNAITIHYSSLSYLQSRKNNYKYRMIGFETDWNEVDSRRTATYRNLPSGEYTFAVTSSNNDGIWSKEPRTLAISILPWWWETKLFRYSAFTLAVLLIFFVYFFRTQSLKKQSRRLESKVAERTKKLHDANLILADRQEEIACQNAELARHRNELEEIVKERTVQMKEALERAKDSERLKSAFLANISHEIRTPMNAIVGFSSLLDDLNVEEQERKEFIDLIRSNADLLVGLIDDIVEISQIESNQVSSNLHPIDLNLKLEELELCFELDEDSPVELKFVNKGSPERLSFLTDELLLGQIMTNLLSNAVKYTKEGFINFGYEVREDAVVLYVADSGIGIPAELHDKVFDRFYKVTENASELYRGLGLGLSITQSLVNLLEGKLTLESEPGKGSTFYVTLPRRHG